MIKQLAHICIYTNDLDETSRFYFEGLGLERGYEFIKDGELFGYYIKLGNDTVALRDLKFLPILGDKPRMDTDKTKPFHRFTQG